MERDTYKKCDAMRDTMKETWNPGLHSRFHERNGFYGDEPSLRQFGAHTRNIWPPVIQKFARYPTALSRMTRGTRFYISSIYLKGNPDLL